MSADDTLNSLYENNLSFRLYADHKYGMSTDELAIAQSRSRSWVEERIEAMRLCLEMQVRFEFTPDSSTGQPWLLPY